MIHEVLIMYFSKRIKEVMVHLGISQSELGRLLGTTSQSVNSWCMSDVIPRRDILEKIPLITGKPLYWFFMSEAERRNAINMMLDDETFRPCCNDLIKLFNRMNDKEKELFTQEIEKISYQRERYIK